MATAAGALICLGGCSSSVSRFDFPSFGLTRSQDALLADPTATASLPVPQESVYASGAPSNGGSYARSSLPPPSGSYAQATPAAYSPAGADITTQSIKPQRAAYAPQAALPRANPAVLRTTSHPRPARTETITVSQGDNLYTLSRRYGVSVDAIQSANNLTDARLKIGQPLVIPGPGSAVAAETRARPAAAASVVASAKPPAAPEVRTVKTTTVPAPGSSGQGTKPESASAVEASSEVIGGGTSRGQNAQIASVDRLPAPEPMSGNSFRWPVQGRIISAFGTKPDGGHNDGINVAVPAGTSVKAAENGVVAYAGNELKGYGNLVLVRHSNSWVSAYAHNGEILVKRGDQVRRGQVIAKAGNSGQVSQPQLHFELRKGSRPVDPTKFMSQTQANAD
ncbi:MAG: peptidoglycan DD-metalloendopeptidase family protein [Methyloceanibacter sp.]